MNKEQFEKKAEELFKKYSYQVVHGGDLVIGENAFDYLIEQLHEALTIPVVSQQRELLKAFIDTDTDVDLLSGHKARLIGFSPECFLVDYNHNGHTEWIETKDIIVKSL